MIMNVHSDVMVFAECYGSARDLTTLEFFFFGGLHFFFFSSFPFNFSVCFFKYLINNFYSI